ncbi:Rmp1p Ecym_4219 [Eremothecium cymbalariae DBVPG|uniref:RNase MRP protein 1 RNA binding domain-containing protein n=1 Tax=Eremothecium cymbalariae (strain CBS 270.75 / DBVPG 7215 / KCTC 17166 / NRRL Y-17582) TaxID=931890 RepID=G8JTD3_ERECY|nr:hypothetical protein Ecym_4219 [Eremothecium cymbalariae DBVPG\
MGVSVGVKGRSEFQFDNANIVDALNQEFRVIHLLYHRNKNQHRVSVWWKQFNMFKRSVAQVLEVLSKREKTQYDWLKLDSLVGKFLRRQQRRAYYEFNNVVALGQFVTLGVVLLGSLAKVCSIYRELVKVNGHCVTSFRCANGIHDKEMGMQPVIDEELGEEIPEDSFSSLREVVRIPPANMSSISKSEVQSGGGLTTKTTTKKRTKRSGKSAIDDIFG